MAYQPLIDVGMNDNLTEVIRKVNTNFKLLNQGASNEKVDIDVGGSVGKLNLELARYEVIGQR